MDTEDKRCPGLEPPVNGHINITSGTSNISEGIGSIALYGCEAGFAIIGEVARACEELKTGVVDWSNTSPICELTISASSYNSYTC